MYQINEQIDNGNGIGTLVLGDLTTKPAWGVNCLICGEFIPFEMHPRICGECKQAVLWAKKKMKEEHNEQI